MKRFKFADCATGKDDSNRAPIGVLEGRLGIMLFDHNPFITPKDVQYILVFEEEKLGRRRLVALSELRKRLPLNKYDGMEGYARFA
jgi:hypothetical protein